MSFTKLPSLDSTSPGKSTPLVGAAAKANEAFPLRSRLAIAVSSRLLSSAASIGRAAIVSLVCRSEGELMIAAGSLKSFAINSADFEYANPRLSGSVVPSVSTGSFSPKLK